MIKFLLSSLVITTLLSSCSPKRNINQNPHFPKTIVLSAFNDMRSASTLDESKLNGLPKVVNLLQDQSSVKNQNNRGTCTFFAIAGIIESAVKKDLNKDLNISEEYLNYTTKAIHGYFDTSEGSTVQYNAMAFKNSGFMLERDWSYQTTWFGRGLPCASYYVDNSDTPASCYSHYAPKNESATKILSSEGITIESFPKNTTEMIKFLAYERRALTMSINVNQNGWAENGDVTYNEMYRKECLDGTSECGGHVVVITGYDLDRRVFFFKNSWGRQWGNKGYGTLSFDNVDRYVTGDLAYAVASNSLTLPSDYDKDHLTLEKFNPKNAVINQAGELDVDIDVKVNNVNGRVVYMSIFLGQKDKTFVEAPSDANSSLFEIFSSESAQAFGDNYIKSVAYSFTDTAGVYAPKEGQVFVMTIPKFLMELGTVKSLRESTTVDPALRATIYVHTDDQGFKILNRQWLPIAK